MTEAGKGAAESIVLFTIGFTGKSAKDFFGRLQEAGVKRLVDIRLNNVSQLAGFTKKQDLEFFLHSIAGIEYRHDLDLAPSKEVFDAYKKGRIDWAEYEKRFKQILAEREPAKRMKPKDFEMACLLCSEDKPDRCHRRLVAEYLKGRWSQVEIRHL